MARTALRAGRRFVTPTALGDETEDALHPCGLEERYSVPHGPQEVLAGYPKLVLALAVLRPQDAAHPSGSAEPAGAEA